MRGVVFVTTFWLSIAFAADSVPASWKYLPHDCSSLVGIRWETARSTILAPALQQEVRFADLDLWKTTDRLVIAGPSELIVVSGTFSLSSLQDQLEAAGLLQIEPDVWKGPESAIALLSDKLLLIGDVSAIKEALAPRRPCPLTPRAVPYLEEDLWVVASRLPDPLAGRFVPIDNEATAFEGSVSVWDGLYLVAAIEQSSVLRAERLAAELKAILQGAEITLQERSVLVRLELNEQQIRESTRGSPAPPEPVQPTLKDKTVRILGLSEGTREIPLGH